jgi:hypothetical protein
MRGKPAAQKPGDHGMPSKFQHRAFEGLDAEPTEPDRYCFDGNAHLAS